MVVNTRGFFCRVTKSMNGPGILTANKGTVNLNVKSKITKYLDLSISLLTHLLILKSKEANTVK